MITHDYSFWASQKTILFSKCLKQFLPSNRQNSFRLFKRRASQKWRMINLGTADIKTWCNNRWMMRRLGLLIQYRIWRHGDGLAVTGNGGLLELRARVHTTDICFTPHFLAITNSPPQWLLRGARLPTQNSTVSWECELGEGEETSTRLQRAGHRAGRGGQGGQRQHGQWAGPGRSHIRHWGSAEETKYCNNTE